MKSILNLAIKELKYDKKVVLAMGFGLIIVIILINSIVTLALSYQQYIVNVSRNKDNWEVRFDNVKYANINLIENDKNVKQISIIKDLGISRKNYGDWFKKYLHIKAYDSFALENLKISLKEGRLPQKSNEIIINYRMNKKIGDTINIIIDEKEIIYEIVGMLEKTEYDKFDSLSLTSTEGAITFLDKNNLKENENIDISIISNNISEIYKTAEKISEDINKVPIYNEELLTYSFVAKEGSEFENSIKVITTVAITIVGIFAIALIYTIFNISINKKKTYVASLRSVGATQKQILYIYLLEGIIITILSFPIGFMISFGINMFVINVFDNLFKAIQGNILNTTLAGTAEVTLYMVCSWKTAIVSILLSITITLISITAPILNISKTQIIEIIRRNKYSKISLRNIEIPKKIGILGTLAIKNINRNRLQYIILVLSIAISMILFIAINGYIVNLNSYNISKEMNYNYLLSINNNMDNDNEEHAKNIIEDLRKEGLIDEIYGLENGNTTYAVIDKAHINNKFDEMVDGVSSLRKLKLKDGSIELKCIPIILSDETYQEYLGEIGEDVVLEKNECIFVNYSDIKTKYGNGINLTTYKEGDILTLNSISKAHPEDLEMLKEFSNAISEALNITDTNEIENKSLELKIKTIANVIPKGFQNDIKNGYITIIVNAETLEEIFFQVNNIKTKCKVNQFKIQSSDTEKLDAMIKILSKEYQGKVNIYGDNNSAEQNANNNEKIIKEILLYSFLVLVGILSTINIFNIVVSNIKVRDIEIVALKAIGTTKKQLNKILILEGILYVALAIFIGLLIGIAILYTLYTNMIDNELYSFEIPYFHIICIILIIYMIVFFSIMYQKRQIDKQNISDILKKLN